MSEQIKSDINFTKLNCHGPLLNEQGDFDSGIFLAPVIVTMERMKHMNTQLDLVIHIINLVNLFL